MLIRRLVPALLFAAPALAAPIDDARRAYQRYDVPAAEASFRQVAGDPAASAADRGEAARELARIAWLVDGRTDAAIDQLTRSLPADPDPCPAAHLLGRALNSGPAPGATPTRLAAYAERCGSIEPGVAVEATRGVLLGALRRRPTERAAALATARRAWEAMPVLARSSLEGERLRLAIGLAGADAATALAGWRGYLWLGDASAPQALRTSDAAVERTFRAGLARDATPADAMALAELLVRVGFGDEARRFARDRGLDRAAGVAGRWRRLAAYFALKVGIVEASLRHDRAYARGRRDIEAGFDAELKALLRTAAAAVGAPTGDPFAALHDAFGLYGVTGRSNGVMGIIVGHTVVDEQQDVRQGNRSGRVRYIAIDNLLSGSFSAWLGDGRSGPAGWASEGNTIVQIRPRYASRVLDHLALAQPGPARARFEARTRELERGDPARLPADGVAFLPGLAARLKLQAVDQIAAEARAGAGAGAGAGLGFEERFRRLWWDRAVEASITLHEGRHVLDQAEFTGDAALDGPELEYRGKLSELALTPRPRIAIASIHSEMLAADNGHGIANRRIMRAYRDWIAAHRGEIAGFDPTQPDLVQLDKLSDDQLRAVAAMLDRAIAKPALAARQTPG